MKVQVLGEIRVPDEQESDNLRVLIEGREYRVEFWSTENSSGTEFYDLGNEGRWVASPLMTDDETEELAQQSLAFWEAYNKTWAAFAGPALIEACLAAGARAIELRLARETRPQPKGAQADVEIRDEVGA